MRNEQAISTLQNSISHYESYKRQITASHMSLEHRQDKIAELDKQIIECKTAIKGLQNGQTRD